MTPNDSLQQFKAEIGKMRDLAAGGPPIALELKLSQLPPITGLRKYPEDDQEKEYYSTQMINLLYRFFESRLSTADRKRLDSPQMTPSMMKQFDDLLVEKAEVYGWRIRLSLYVDARYVQWLEEEQGGIERARRFDEAIRRRARISRGEAQGSITQSQWHDAKKRGVSELRRLMREFKTEFNRRNRAPSFAETCEWFKKTIGKSPANFPFWSQNLEPLMFALQWISENDKGRAERVALGMEGPAALFDLMAAKSENLSESYTRRMISETAKL